MKTASRIALVIGSLFVIALGIRQAVHGVKEISGVPASTEPQKIGDRVAVAQHGCSLRVPSGWERKEKPNGSVLFAAPRASGASANLIVFSEPYDDALRKYADAIIESVKSSVPGAKFGNVAEFVTESGAPSYKVGFRNSTGGIDAAQAMYFFTGQATQKILVTATCSAKDAADLDPLWDACSRSLTVAAP